jgi:hypothetical protein
MSHRVSSPSPSYQLPLSPSPGGPGVEVGKGGKRSERWRESGLRGLFVAYYNTCAKRRVSCTLRGMAQGIRMSVGVFVARVKAVVNANRNAVRPNWKAHLASVMQEREQ